MKCNFYARLMILLGFTTSSSAFASAYDSFLLQLRPPHSDSAILSKLEIDPDAKMDLKNLRIAAIEATSAVHVPYVWGGNSIGSVETCLSCNKCLTSKKVGAKSRVRACPSCAKCGIDCSHLVNQIFAAAGMGYPYAASNTLARSPASVLFRQYQMIDLGKDFSQARPGDIIVYRKHVGLLMANHGGQRGDLIHASRFAIKGRPRAGGIRYDIDSNIVRARGGLVRILRHQRLGQRGQIPLS